MTRAWKTLCLWGKSFEMVNNPRVSLFLMGWEKYNGMDQAMEHARQMVEDGADIIDVGGESTRPGHIMITDEEEIARVTPIIEKLKKEFDVPFPLILIKVRWQKQQFRQEQIL